MGTQYGVWNHGDMVRQQALLWSHVVERVTMTPLAFITRSTMFSTAILAPIDARRSLLDGPYWAKPGSASNFAALMGLLDKNIDRIFRKGDVTFLRLDMKVEESLCLVISMGMMSNRTGGHGGRLLGQDVIRDGNSTVSGGAVVAQSGGEALMMTVTLKGHVSVVHTEEDEDRHAEWMDSDNSDDDQCDQSVINLIDDSSAEDVKKGYDIQGIPWLGPSRDLNRWERLEYYVNVEDVAHSGRDSEKALWATTKHDVYLIGDYSALHWSSLALEKREVIDLLGHVAPSEVHEGSLSKGFFKPEVCSLAVKDNLLVAGGFNGEIICKFLDREGISYCCKLKNDENGGTHSLEIFENPSGSVHFLASNIDRQVRDFDVETFKICNNLHFPWVVHHTSLSPDGKLAVVVGDSTNGLLVDACSGQRLHELRGHLDYSFASAWNPDGQTFATGNQDMTCLVWDVRNLSQSIEVSVVMMTATLKGHVSVVHMKDEDRHTEWVDSDNSDDDQCDQSVSNLIDDSSAEDVKKGYDIQGIPWLGPSRDLNRWERLEYYVNVEDVAHSGRDSEKALQESTPTEKGQVYYEFEYNTRAVKPIISHFQLRNLVWATTKHDVYLIGNYSALHWSSLTLEKREVIDLLGHVALSEFLDRVGISYCCKLKNDENGAIWSIRYTSDGKFMAMAESADFVHTFDVASGLRRRQELDFFGEVAGMSFRPDTEVLYVGVDDEEIDGLLQFNRRRFYSYLDAEF
ncbi:hypothetical protein EJB05_48506, partial [Eragrostis curvula]